MTQTPAVADWMDHAACAGQDPLMWDEAGGADLVTQGIAVCRTCPVWQSCRDHAARLRADGTIWAGLLFVNGKPRDTNSDMFRSRIANVGRQATARGPRTGPCPICGGTPADRRRVYCDATCRAAARRKRAQEGAA